MAVRATFVASFLLWAAGNGIMPLLPVRAGLLGMENQQIGWFLAGAFAALLAGTLAVGRFFDRIRYPSVLVIVCGPLGVAGFVIMALARTAPLFIAGTLVAWACTGSLIAALNAAAGLRFPPERRGKLFGALSATIPGGALVGGFSAGAIVDATSFAVMFGCAAGIVGIATFTLFWPVRGLEVGSSARKRDGRGNLPRSARFWCFIVATTMAAATGFAARIGTPLVMASGELSNFWISGTVAVGGLLALPLSPLVGKLSDRVGRLGPILFCTLALGAGLAVIPWCSTGWHYWISGMLVSMFFYVGFGLGLALMSDLVEEKDMGLGVGIYQGAQWTGGISGILVTGMILGPDSVLEVFLGAGALSIISILLLLAAGWLGRRERPRDDIPVGPGPPEETWQTRMTRTSLPP